MSQQHIDDMIWYVDELGENLTDWEKEFIRSLIDERPASYSEKQISIVYKLYNQKC